MTLWDGICHRRPLNCFFHTTNDLTDAVYLCQRRLCFCIVFFLLDFTLLKVLLTDFAGQIGMITVDEIRERVPKYHLHPGVLGNIGYPFVRWRHPMETFSALLALCAGNSLSPVNSPAQRPVTRSFDVFFDLRLNKRLSKRSWFRDLRRYRAHYDVTVMDALA